MSRHVMIDIETMGLTPRAAIVAIAAVEFQPFGQGIVSQFYAPVRLDSSLRAGMEIDAETVLWWMRQGPEARAAIAENRDKALNLGHALSGLSDYLIGPCWGDEKKDELAVWANGPSFDFPILGEAFRLCEMEKPWHHRNERCCRTIAELFPEAGPENDGEARVKHHALADACHQVACVQAAFGPQGR